MPRVRRNSPDLSRLCPQPAARASRRRSDPNKALLVVRSGVASVYAQLQADSGTAAADAHLLEWARKNPDLFYRLALLLRPLPEPPRRVGRPRRLTRVALVTPGLDPDGPPPAGVPRCADPPDEVEP